MQQRAGKDDVGPGSEGTREHEACSAGQESHAAKATVAVGDGIVQKEVLKHGNEGRRDLCRDEADVPAKG